MKHPYVIELTGSNTAACPELNLEITRRKHGVEDELARAMLKAGADPDRQVRIVRNGTLVFKMGRTVAQWAAKRLTEEQNGFSRRKFRADPRYAAA